MIEVLFNVNLVENLGFIIISPEPNLGRLKSTCTSIRNNYGIKSDIICIVCDQTKENLEDYNSYCPSFKGRNTITSLINLGFKKTKKAWNILIVEGSYVKANIDRKYCQFIKDEKNILFPVVCDYDIQGKPTKIYNNFWDCSLNGMLIHKETFKKVGNFSDTDLAESRLFWCYEAQRIGCEFKAILGAKMC